MNPGTECYTLGIHDDSKQQINCSTLAAATPSVLKPRLRAEMEREALANPENPEEEEARRGLLDVQLG